MPRPSGYSLSDLLAANGGEIQVVVALPDSSPASAAIRARYHAASADLKAVSEQTWEFDGSIPVPLSSLVNGEALALRSLEVLSARAQAPIKTVMGAELESLRSKARKGVALHLTIDPDQDGSDSLVGERVTRNAVPPIAAAPDTAPVALPSGFSLSGLAADALVDRLRDLATATESYHRELLGLVENAVELDHARLAAVLDSVYFNAETHARLARAAATLSTRRDPLSLSLVEVVKTNLALATAFGPLSNRILEAGLPKVADLSAESGLALLRRAFPLGGVSASFELYVARFAPATPETRRELIELAKAKREPRVLPKLAAEWFRSDSDGSASSLIALAEGIAEGEALDRMVLEALPGLRSATHAEAKRIIAVLGTEEGVIRGAPALISRVEPLDGRQFNDLAQAIPMGHPRDRVIQASLPSLAAVSTLEARLILRSVFSGEAKRAVAAGLFARVPAFDVGKLMDIVVNTYQREVRDQMISDGVRALPASERLTCSRFGDLLALSTAKAARPESFTTLSGLLETALPRLSDLTVANAIGVVEAAAPGALRDAFAARVLERVSDLSSRNLPALARLGSTAAKQSELQQRGEAIIRSRRTNRPAR